MNSQTLFLLGCIPTRLLLAYVITLIKPFSPLSIIINLTLSMIALGFITIYIFGWRKTGPETMGAPIWWNHWRPLHGALYGIAAY